MTSLNARRVGVMVVLVSLLAALTVLLLPQPAAADVTGGCMGSVDFSADTEPAYGPDNDTKDNPIIVPKDDGNIASWTGSVPGENKDFGGKVEIRLGPVWLEVADWGNPDHDGSNEDDERSDFGDYAMDQVWDVLPKNIAQGIYEARASHSASGVDCDAQFFVKFEGNAWESPIVIVAVVLLVIFLLLLLIAGRATGRAGFFRGRPVFAVVAALFLAITIAVLLQQFCIQPLDNTTTILLPLALIVIGLIIAKFAPFGGGGGLGRELGRKEVPVAPGAVTHDDISKAIDGDPPEIFEDGFESGDTSAWGDTDG